MVGVAGFEPAASSSRTQVTESVGSASALLTCNASSIGVPWRPSLATVVVTHLVTQAFRLAQGALVLNPLMRSSGQVVQDRPGGSALWTDVPDLSTRDRRRLAAWQQCWQQSSTIRSHRELGCLIQWHLYSTGMTVLTQVDLGALARVGKALADPTRRRVLVQLIDGPGYPAEMADDFGTTRANLSNHLTCLRECGLVTATVEGRRVRYELADQRLADGLRILAALDLPGTCQ